MRKLLLVLALLLSLPLITAANLEVDVIEKNSIIIVESDENATFTLSITSKENITDQFEIYSLVGITIFPKEFFTIEEGDTKELRIIASPHKETKRDFRDFYVFEYQIKGKETGFYTDRLTIKILELKDAIDITVENINLDDEEVTLILTNLEDFDFDDLSINVESLFFEHNETLDIGSKEHKKITVPIKKDEIKGLSAGEYEVKVILEINDKESEKTSTVKFLEKGGISVFEGSSGLIVNKKTTTKTNEGNILSNATIDIEKNVLTRLFTTYSETPLTSERKGLIVEYSWQEELEPGESFSIVSTTNYTIPFALLIIIILVIIIVKVMLSKNLVLQKRVSLVRTKGEEFALKVKIRAKAKKSMENIRLIDSIPRLTKLYEKFGTKPDKIDPKTRRLMWNIKRLNAGEERIFTYIIYSKVNIIGKFELPAAHATFERDSKHDRVFSNKTYFAAESSEDREE